MTATSVLIRVQARGGKYLGPNVNYAQVSVLNGDTVIFGPCLASGNSGEVEQTFAPTASRDVIVVQPTLTGPPAGAYWLLPSGNDTAGIVATFDLEEPALLEFRATALYETVNPVTATAMMWVVPGMQLTKEPGLLLSIPGLSVTLAPPDIGSSVTVTATVTMMCGCPITAPTWPPPSGGPEPYWPEPELQVFAILKPPSGTNAGKTMTFTGTNTFTASFPLPPPGQSTIIVYAVQPAEANVGYAQQTFSLPAT